MKTIAELLAHGYQRFQSVEQVQALEARFTIEGETIATSDEKSFIICTFDPEGNALLIVCLVDNPPYYRIIEKKEPQ